jgi:hypothetical protein
MSLTAFTGSPQDQPSRLARFLSLVAEWLPAQRLEAEDKTYLNERVLRTLVLARVILSAAGLMAMGFLAVHSGAEVPVLSAAAILVALALLSWVGLSRAKDGAATTETDVLLQMVGDVLILTLVLALTAARDSPFDHLFLLPVVLSAYALTGWRVGLVLVLIAAGWTVSYQMEGNTVYPPAFDILAHLSVGGLIAYFSFGVARISRRQERILAGNRERVISALGAEASTMLATRAAHTLSTPLGTMAILVADLREGHIPAEEQEAALDTLAAEIATCKLHLSGLLRSSGADRGEGGYRADVVHFLTEMRDDCLITYPGGSVTLTWPEDSPYTPEIAIELSLFNALAGVVKDFVREEPFVANLVASWDVDGVLIRVCGEDACAADGRAPEKPTINGRRRERLAVLAAITDRHGGSVSLEPAGGRCITVRLPHADQRPRHAR